MQSARTASLQGRLMLHKGHGRTFWLVSYRSFFWLTANDRRTGQGELSIRSALHRAVWRQHSQVAAGRAAAGRRGAARRQDPSTSFARAPSCCTAITTDVLAAPTAGYPRFEECGFFWGQHTDVTLVSAVVSPDWAPLKDAAVTAVTFIRRPVDLILSEFFYVKYLEPRQPHMMCAAGCLDPCFAQHATQLVRLRVARRHVQTKS